MLPEALHANETARAASITDNLSDIFISPCANFCTLGLVPRVTYYSRVGLELGKLIAHQRGMAPPYVLQSLQHHTATIILI